MKLSQLLENLYRFIYSLNNSLAAIAQVSANTLSQTILLSTDAR